MVETHVVYMHTSETTNHHCEDPSSLEATLSSMPRGAAWFGESRVLGHCTFGTYPPTLGSPPLHVHRCLAVWFSPSLHLPHLWPVGACGGDNLWVENPTFYQDPNTGISYTTPFLPCAT